MTTLSDYLQHALRDGEAQMDSTFDALDNLTIETKRIRAERNGIKEALLKILVARRNNQLEQLLRAIDEAGKLLDI